MVAVDTWITRCRFEAQIQEVLVVKSDISVRVIFAKSHLWNLTVHFFLFSTSAPLQSTLAVSLQQKINQSFYQRTLQVITKVVYEKLAFEMLTRANNYEKWKRDVKVPLLRVSGV